MHLLRRCKLAENMSAVLKSSSACQLMSTMPSLSACKISRCEITLLGDKAMARLHQLVGTLLAALLRRARAVCSSSATRSKSFMRVS